MSASTPPIGFRGLLAHRRFRRLWIGQATSAIGDQVYVVALAVLVIQAGGGASELGIAMAGRAVAMVLFLLVGGVVADRFARTRVMLAADLVRGVAVVGVAVQGTGTPLALLVALSLVIGAGEAFFRPAYTALLPGLLPASQLAAGNALSSVSARASLIVGPALAGGLIAVGGVQAALLLDAATFAVSMATLARLRSVEPPLGERPANHALRELLEGLRAVRERPWLATVIGVCSVQLLLAIAPWLVLLPIVAEASLGGSGAYSLLLVAFGAGSLAGAAVIGRWRPRQPGVAAVISLLATGVMLFALAGPAPVAIVAVAVFASGIGEQVFDVLWITAVQRDVPNELLGRVASLDYTFSLALQPLGLALAGPVAGAIGVSELLTIGGIVVFVSTLPLLAMPTVRALASGPPERAAAPG